jgi:hypothetical protein
MIAENIASQYSIKTLDLIHIFEGILERKANHVIKQAGGAYSVPMDRCLATAKALNIDLGMGYAQRCIRKYYDKPST